MRVLVTGATGFVGTALCEMLDRRGYTVRAAQRVLQPRAGQAFDAVAVGEIGPSTDWNAALEDVQAVVHLAARVHVMRETATDPLSEFRYLNVGATENLAHRAAAAGVKRFVYVSSIKVNGESTKEKAFTASAVPRPEDAYAQSKLDAERVLLEIGNRSGIEVVIVRPPLVYGPGVKGNFLSLLRWIKCGLPIPLARCNNRRSLVGITNLADLLIRCVSHPAASNKIILAGDGEDLSTPELIQRLARVLGQQVRLLSVPTSWLRFASYALGRPGVYERLCSSLQIDIAETKLLLEWRPPLTVNEEFERTARWFLRNDRSR